MKFKSCLLSLLAMFSASSFSAEDCEPRKVINIQVEDTKVLVNLEGASWHLVGKFGTNEKGVNDDYLATNMKLSVLMSAHAQGKPVTLRFPDGYNCTSYNTTIPSLMVRLSN
ncbi:hypothetical protein N473_12960 [Pseudoalteromonas luteoviolacea CPMOR-1]|uniref:Uncharacterized protein n=1 Tax=Pseudoalteromonas luteoviolacea CPMOR-1 TaxID=1365248 RepID=A0A162B0V7_9GAMM|nr:hypothetical protein [Pseudoalteromonas luteoviolacea]KZN64695.1 hypothetical protein N473_12960 [Pseudoalteromonas luteoviolacea CPMOR-1]